MAGEKLTIINLGPIAKCEIELGKFNVLTGKQSSGKSTEETVGPDPITETLRMLRKYYKEKAHRNSIDKYFLWHYNS